jgi:hypothetical protein
MDPDKTTTIGDGELDMTESPFHIMKAVERTSAKFRTWAASCRGCIALRPSMAAAVCAEVWATDGAELGWVSLSECGFGRLERFFCVVYVVSKICWVWTALRKRAVGTMVEMLMPDVLRFVGCAAGLVNPRTPHRSPQRCNLQCTTPMASI